MNGFRQGKKLPIKDIQRRIEAYNRKLEEYKLKSLDELKELFPSLGGSYKEACIEATRIKMLEKIVEESKNNELNNKENENT